MRVFKKHNVERKVDSEAAAEKLKRQGFVEVVGKAENATETKSISKMKLEELKALAAEKEIEGYESLTKPELIAVLKDVM